jgi:glycosyltransferase involved in cell wall biosynthesis
LREFPEICRNVGQLWSDLLATAKQTWQSATNGPLADSTQRIADAAVLVISHDAHMAGAQYLLLSLLAEWKRRGVFPVKVICVADGPLRTQFEALFPTLVLTDFGRPSARKSAVKSFTREPVRAIYSSTVVNGPLLEELRPAGAPAITHCHELQQSIERWAPGKIMAATLCNSDYFLSGCNAVADNLHRRHQVPQNRLEVVYDFIDPWDDSQKPDTEAVLQLRQELGISASDIVVFGCGTTDWRKGPDLFLQAATLACEKISTLKCFWIGGEQGLFARDIAASNLSARIQFIGNKPVSRRYYYTGHIFALTSREDPCPLVALEAADANLPVVCFDNAGDIPLVLGNACGAVVPFEDAAAFAAAIISLALDSEQRTRAGQLGHDRVATQHSSHSAALAIENAIKHVQRMERTSAKTARTPLVSVIVPNYNHSRYLPQRLATIAKQTLRNIEIVVLDDASTDDSRNILEAFVGREPRACLLPNLTNSGSTFKQWQKGMRMAAGKYIWIAESDDAADPAFLKTLVARLEADSSIAFACSQLRMMDTDSRLGDTPDDWFGELDPVRWKSDFINDGMEEIRHFLSKKNTVLNASGVVFRNFPGIESLVDDSMRLCADWLFWIRLLARGQIAYCAKPLNYWRLNSSNARTRPPGELEWQEGQAIIGELGNLLGWGTSERAAMLDGYRARCSGWTAASSPQQ